MRCAAIRRANAAARERGHTQPSRAWRRLFLERKRARTRADWCRNEQQPIVIGRLDRRRLEPRSERRNSRAPGKAMSSGECVAMITWQDDSMRRNSLRNSIWRAGDSAASGSSKMNTPGVGDGPPQSSGNPRRANRGRLHAQRWRWLLPPRQQGEKSFPVGKNQAVRHLWQPARAQGVRKPIADRRLDAARRIDPAGVLIACDGRDACEEWSTCRCHSRQ